jgi:hypothetical protein
MWSISELKLAFRALLKHPGFTWIAVLTIALGERAGTRAREDDERQRPADAGRS